MTEAEIQAAIGKRLLTMPSCPPIIWPNNTEQFQPPYLIVEFVSGDRVDDTLSGGCLVSSGYAVITVLTPVDINNSLGLAMSQAILSLFPYCLRLNEGETCVTVNQPPQPVNNYRDGPYWRAPVRVSYEAT